MADPNKSVGENWIEATREKDEAYQNEREQNESRYQADRKEDAQRSQAEEQNSRNREMPDRDAELGIGCSRSATSTPPPPNEPSSNRSRQGHQQRREPSPPSHPNSNTCGRSTHLHSFARPRPSLAGSTPSAGDRGDGGCSRGQSGHATSFVGAAGGGSAAHQGQGTGDDPRLSRAPSAFGDTGQEGNDGDGDDGEGEGGDGQRKQGSLEGKQKGNPDQRSSSQSSDRSVGIKGGQEDEVWRKGELIESWARVANPKHAEKARFRQRVHQQVRERYMYCRERGEKLLFATARAWDSDSDSVSYNLQ